MSALTQMLLAGAAATLPAAALGLSAGAAVDALTRDPALRLRTWTLGLGLAPTSGMAVMALAPNLRVPQTVQLLPEVIAAAPPAILAAAPVRIVEPGLLEAVLVRASDLAPSVLAGVIAAGAAAGLVNLARRHLRLGQLVRHASPAPDDQVEQLAALARGRGLMPPRLLISDRLTTPLLAGWRRPAILLPRSGGLSGEALSRVLGHELAHLARRDTLRGLAEDLIGAALWFNPFVAILRQRLSAAREEQCDAQALAGADAGARRQYAETLVETLRLGACPDPHTALIGAGRNVAMRLKSILNPPSRPGQSRRLAIMAVGVALALGVGITSLAVAVQAAPDTASRQAVWRQTSQETSFAPKAGITVAAEMVDERPGNISVWRGRPTVELLAATGDRGKDADLAKVRFEIDGVPAPRGFEPRSVPPERIDRIEITSPAQPGEGVAVVNLVMAPPAPPAPPPARAPKAPPAPPAEPEAPPAPPAPPPPAPSAAPAPPAPPPAPPPPPGVSEANWTRSQAKYRDADAAALRRYCASDDPGEMGFCFGALFGRASQPGVCAPGDEQQFANRAVASVLATRPRPGEGLRPYTDRVVKATFACVA